MSLLKIDLKKVMKPFAHLVGCFKKIFDTSEAFCISLQKQRVLLFF